MKGFTARDTCTFAYTELPNVLAEEKRVEQ